jgi:hypothetical protein
VKIIAKPVRLAHSQNSQAASPSGRAEDEIDRVTIESSR